MIGAWAFCLTLLTGSAGAVEAPITQRLEVRLPVYEKTGATVIRVPQREMELGLATPEYKCWRLRLNGEHGREVRRTMSRLRSVQSAIKTLSSDLRKAAKRYADNDNKDVVLGEHLEQALRTLDGLVERYKTLLNKGKEKKLLRYSTGGLFSSRSVVSPILQRDDYTMVYDDSAAECPPRTKNNAT
jgi:hypothetical protein